MFSIYFIPILIIISGTLTSPFLTILLYAIAGLGMAGIGMGVMHDANHGAYTSKARLNNFLSHSIDIVGCSSAVWKLQHNVLHHTYTNIQDHDEDIQAPLLLRFSPNGKHYKIHRFQHYYVWFIYSILTLYWVTGKDFVKSKRYYNMGLIPSKKAFRIRTVKLILIKLLYFAYALVLPILMSPLSFGWIILGFLIMHLLAGILLSVVFQLAHVVPEMKFPLPDNQNNIENNWYVHQLQTTSNFSPRNPLFFWYMGGLTNQIEHHLFPNICHIHYRKLSKIVQLTAEEFGIPYHVNRSFLKAIYGHVTVLKSLGKVQIQ